MKRALQLASVASMIDLFNEDNISILHELGFVVDVAANFDEGSITSKERVNEYKKELQSRNIDVYHIPIPRSIFKVKDIVKSYKMVKKLAEEKKYDIMHCHSPIGGVIARFAFRKAKKIGTRVIYTAHGFHFFKGASIKNWLLFYPIERICARYCDTIITINKEDYERAKTFKCQDVQYVPGIGVDIEEIRMFSNEENRSRLRKEYDIKKDDFVLMSIGQLSKRKNHSMVIEAMASLKELNIKYLLVGTGEMYESLKALVSKFNLENKVIFAGYVKDAKKLLCAADCFVFPSLQEGLPVSLMEAMASGVPCIASDIRGNKDLLENKHLFELKDVDTLAAKINELYCDKDERKNSIYNMSNKMDMIDINKVRLLMKCIYYDKQS